MLESLLTLLGEYTPVMATYQTVLADGTIHEYQTVAAGVAGVDWPWVASALLFIVVIYGLMRMLGGVLRG